MRFTSRQRLFASLALGLGSVFTAQQAQAATTVYAVTENDFLITFDPLDPENLISSISLETYMDFDSLPRYGSTFALDRRLQSDVPFRLLGLSLHFGSLTIPEIASDPLNNTNFDLNPFGSALVLNGLSYGMDIDPTTGSPRIVTDINKNYYGFSATPQPDLFYAVGDVNEGEDPSIVSIAYSFEPTPRLFGLDSKFGTLVQIDGPTGEITTIGETGVGVNGTFNSFDINQEDGLAYMANGGNIWHIDLASGQASNPLTGTVSTNGNSIGPGGTRIVAMTTVPEPTSLALLGLGGLLVTRRRRR